MPAFQYEALNATGERSRGTVEATDRGEAVRKLARRGLQPHSVTASVDSPAGANAVAPRTSGAPPPPAGSQRVTLKRGQVIQFTEELTDLLKAGLQLEQALASMENRSLPLMRELSRRLREKVRDGVPLSSALNQVSPSFGELYCNLAAAGEAGGSLGDILGRQARHLQQMETLRAKVANAMIYPAFIIASGLVLFIVFVTYLLPKLAVLLESTAREVPVVVRWLMALSDFFKSWWWLLLLMVALAVVAVVVLFQDKGRRAWWHRVQLRLPVFGPVLRARFEVQFLETLGTLLHNGLPLHRALELVRKTTGNLYQHERLGAVEALVGDGGSLSRALEKAGVVRPLVVDMVRVGEQTGDMADALDKAAERFDRDLGVVIARATELVQPVIMLGMAVMVGGMAWMMVNIVFSTLQQMNAR